jgi:hypothetical protein
MGEDLFTQVLGPGRGQGHEPRVLTVTNPDEATITSERHLALARALGRMPTEQRWVLEGSWGLELTQRPLGNMAHALGLSKEACWSLREEATRALAQDEGLGILSALMQTSGTSAALEALRLPAPCAGHSFNLCLVRPGERHGKPSSGTHMGRGAIVEVFDAESTHLDMGFEFEPLGTLLKTFDLGSLLSHPSETDILPCGAVQVHVICASEAQRVLHWLARA